MKLGFSDRARHADARVVIYCSACALAAGGLYGLGGTINQLFARTGLDIVSLTVMQYATATAILGLVTCVWHRGVPSLKDVGQLALLGAFMSGSSVTYYLAIDNLTVGQGVASEFQYVWMAMVAQAIMDRKAPRLKTIILMFALVAGSLLGSGLADELAGTGIVSVNPQGIEFGFASAAFYALFLVLNGLVAPTQPVVSRTFVMAAAGCVVLLTFSCLRGLGTDMIAASALPGLVQGLCMVVGPLSLFGIAARGISGEAAAVLAAVELPVAVITGAIVLGTPVSPFMVVGVVLICLGVSLKLD